MRVELSATTLVGGIKAAHAAERIRVIAGVARDAARTADADARQVVDKVPMVSDTVEGWWAICSGHSRFS